MKIRINSGIPEISGMMDEVAELIEESNQENSGGEEDNKDATPNSQSKQGEDTGKEGSAEQKEGKKRERRNKDNKAQDKDEQNEQDGQGDQEQEKGEKEYNIGDKPYASIKSEPFRGPNGKFQIQKEKAIWEIIGKKELKPYPVKEGMSPSKFLYKVRNKKGKEYWVRSNNIEEEDLQKDLDAKKQREEEAKRKEEEQKRQEEEQRKAQEEAEKEAERKRKEEEENKRKEEERLAKLVDSKAISTIEDMKNRIKAGITNLWMKGPAGCGKSVMARELAKELEVDYYCISCGVGTSSTEFIGYKYPERQATRFADFYTKPSIILIDEMTALDASVAQILNSALANGEIETTTGIIQRDPECVIIATSNTFGSGADRLYVANNQLDASTIDRFVGGIIDVDYSRIFESQYEKEVTEFVLTLRKLMKLYELRKVASTRMIQAGIKLREVYKDWKKLLVANWEEHELKQIEQLLN